MNKCSFALIVHFQKETDAVFFSVRMKNGIEKRIDDNEPLKAYENGSKVFSLPENIDLLLQYIDENFDGESQADLIMEAETSVLEKMQFEFDGASEAISRHNQDVGIAVTLSKKVRELQTISINSNSEESPTTRKKVAFIGKIHTGKTELIKACIEHLSLSYDVVHHKGYVEYSLSDGTALYEINGIDLGLDNFEKATTTLNIINQSGLSHVVYCFYSMTGKMEDVERDLIHDFQKANPEVVVCAAVNMSLDPDSSSEFANVINKAILDTPVFITLAKEMRTKMGYVSPYGVENLVAFWRDSK